MLVSSLGILEFAIIGIGVNNLRYQLYSDSTQDIMQFIFTRVVPVVLTRWLYLSE